MSTLSALPYLTLLPPFYLVCVPTLTFLPLVYLVRVAYLTVTLLPLVYLELSMSTVLQYLAFHIYILHILTNLSALL